MLQPADLLILDEPTNDLDIPTLEVLEESLMEFPGALVLVTHDRFLLDSVSTHVLALDGQGGAELFADYAQWESRRGRPLVPLRKPTAPKPVPPPKPTPTAKRLSYKEKLEWEGMEEGILAAETALAAAQQAVEDPAVATEPGGAPGAVRGPGGGPPRGRAALRALGGAGGEAGQLGLLNV